MNNYEQAKEEFLMFQKALDNAKKTEMEVEWFSAFTDVIYHQSIMSDFPGKDMNKIIDKANKKLGM